jgi:diguanylate cyclase (GGDEF)-like protein
VLISDPKDALKAVRSVEPSVIIVEAALSISDGTKLYEVLQDAADFSAPIIVLCSNFKEAIAVAETDVFDVVPKPLEWQLIGRRALQAAQAGRTAAQLDQARASLSKALELADSARQHLRSRESFEPVTGLPNKSKFMDLLVRGMSAADRGGNLLAVFVIGFSRFRLVIEAMGQETADLALAEIGARLNHCLHDATSAQVHTSGLRTAAAASIGSASFGLMLTGSAETDEMSVLRQQLTERLSRPVQVSGQTVYLSASVGIAIYPQDASDADSLLQRADNAMRDAQSRGGGFRFYCPDTDAAAARKLKIEHMLHESFDRGELELAYQPLTDVASGRIVGAEALLRWQQPDLSYISPSEFVPIAEESGLMIQIGEFVLDTACEQLKIWRLAGKSSFRMAVNVSKIQLMNSDFVGLVGHVLQKHDVEPACVDLELSERGVLSGNHDVISQLHKLKKLGVKISIDDFGAGDSAISYLKELPIDVLKIDRSYINGLTHGGKDAALTSAMVSLGQKLDLTVVAEGVETPEQLSILREIGCDEYQGFLMSAAIPSEEFARLMQENDKK